MHVDPVFEAEHGFCREDCPECDRLDQVDLAKATTPKLREELAARGVAMGLAAAAEEERRPCS